MAEAPGKLFQFNLTDTTVKLVQAGSTLMYLVNVHNPDAAAAHLQLFNAAAIADVTLGTTVPDLSLQIPIGVDTVFPPDGRPWAFDKGLCIAASVEPQGATDTGSDMHVYMTYS